jgi:hypothetical protein
MSYQRTLRKPGNHALTALAEMGEKDTATFGSMMLPLARGGIEPADISGYRAIEFEARGDGRYSLVPVRRSVSSRRAVALDFEAGPRWRKVRLRFAEPYPDLLSLQFRMEREPSRKVWLELDNIRLVR